MGLFNRRQKNYNNEVEELKQKVYKLSSLLGADPNNLSPTELLSLYPFLFVDKYKSEPYLFSNQYCAIETYIACTCKVYINCYVRIRGSKFKRDMFTKRYKDYCAKIIANMYHNDYATILELIEKRYQLYLARETQFYNYLQQLVLYSQNTDEFVEYDRKTPLIVFGGVQDIHLQTQIQSILIGLESASEGQCAEVAAGYSSGYSNW